MEGLDSLIAKRKAELAERLKSGDKALINVNPISPEKKPSPTKREESEMGAEELIKSLRDQVAAANQTKESLTLENDDWRGKELKDCYIKISSLEEELRSIK